MLRGLHHRKESREVNYPGGVGIPELNTACGLKGHNFSEFNDAVALRSLLRRPNVVA
jgi:hypothetical protein